MYVSYTPPPGGLSTAAAGDSLKPCNGGEADARTRTGDPFITRKALAPDASPREGTPAPIPTAILAGAPSGPATPSEARETRPVYAVYTPTRPGDRFTPPFHARVSLACATGHHRICRDHPTRLCGCRCHDPITRHEDPPRLVTIAQVPAR